MLSLELELRPLENFRQYIEKHGDEPLPEHRRVWMAMDVAFGLSHASSRKVQHADSSCRNLLILETHRVKVGDLGVSILEGSGLAETACELPRRGRAFDETAILRRVLSALGSAI